MAIARNPEKLKGVAIEVIPGTPYDYETVDKAITGCSAVINVLNVSRKSDNPWASPAAPPDLISKSAFNAVKAMEKPGILRYVALGALGAGRSWTIIPFIMKFVFSCSNLKLAIRDHGRQEEILERSSLDYTVCRAPMLSTKINGTGVVVSPDNVKPSGPVLSRNSAAEFFIKIIENNECVREIINLSNKPKLKRIREG